MRSSIVSISRPYRGDPMRIITLVAFLPLVALADMKITFIDARQADAAVIQIDQDSGKPFTIVVDGGDGDSDLEDN